MPADLADSAKSGVQNGASPGGQAIFLSVLAGVVGNLTITAASSFGTFPQVAEKGRQHRIIKKECGTWTCPSS